MSVKGVFFDLGGTLFSYRNLRRATGPLLMHAARQMGLDGEPADVGRAYQRASSEISRSYAELDFYLHRDLFRDTFLRFVEHMNGRFDEDIYRQYQQNQHEALLSHLHLREDCVETLAHLQGLGLYLSIVSNIDDDMLEPLVERESLHRYLDHWTSSESAASCKPHRRFFEISLEKSGLAAEEVLFVGDSPEHDVHGAGQVGMQTVLIVEDGIEPPLQSGRETPEPDYVIMSLSQLKDLF